MIINPFEDDTVPGPPDEDSDYPASRSAGKNSAAEQGLEVPMGWKPTANEPVPVVRCTGMSSTTGERCKKWSLRGARQCVRHGGQLPTVRAHAEAVVDSARMELMGMAGEAVDVLFDLMKAGTADAVRLKAAENVLNRSGIKDAIEVHVEVTNVSASTEIQKKLATMRARIEPKAEEPEDLGEVEEDAEEVVTE